LIMALVAGIAMLMPPSMTPNVYASENVDLLVNEWNYRFDRYAIDFNQTTNRSSWTHKELKDRVPFYDEILGAWPISIRMPKQVFVPKNLATDTCFLAPVQIRAEVDLSYLKYAPSPIEIEFWPRVVMQGQTLSFQGPNLIVGPKDWSGSQQIIEKKIPICVSKEISGKDIIAFFMRTNIFYSRLFSEFKAPRAECWSHTIEACQYIGAYGGHMNVVQSAYDPVDEGKGFEGTISQLKEHLLTISSLEKQNIEITKRNLAFAERELPAAQARSIKLREELEAKAEAAKALAEAQANARLAQAKAEAEAKAKAEAEAQANARLAQAKAEAEAKAKAEAEAKAKAEAEAKAKAEAEAKAKASSQKSITCVKGKSSLKVVGKNPKCPKGYKRK